jgi:hypothetical protein
MAPVRNKNGTPSDDDDKLILDGKDDKPKRKRQSQSLSLPSHPSSRSLNRALLLQAVMLAAHERCDVLATTRTTRPLVASTVFLLEFLAPTTINPRRGVLPISTSEDFRRLRPRLSEMPFTVQTVSSTVVHYLQTGMVSPPCPPVALRTTCPS